MKAVLLAAGALAVGFALGAASSHAAIRRLRRKVRVLRYMAGAGKPPASIFQSVTKFLFITAQVFAIVWVSLSYSIAIYATVKLEQAFPVTELSQQAMITIIGAMALKVVENVFEHNEGLVFGRSPGTGESLGEAPTDEESPEDPAEEAEERG